jgi:hypothetical protein
MPFLPKNLILGTSRKNKKKHLSYFHPNLHQISISASKTENSLFFNENIEFLFAHLSIMD